MDFGSVVARDVVEAAVASLAVARDSVLARLEALELEVDVFVLSVVDVIEDTASDSSFLDWKIHADVEGGVWRITLNAILYINAIVISGNHGHGIIYLEVVYYDLAVGVGCSEGKSAGCSSESEEHNQQD